MIAQHVAMPDISEADAEAAFMTLEETLRRNADQRGLVVVSLSRSRQNMTTREDRWGDFYLDAAQEGEQVTAVLLIVTAETTDAVVVL